MHRPILSAYTGRSSLCLLVTLVLFASVNCGPGEEPAKEQDAGVMDMSPDQSTQDMPDDVDMGVQELDPLGDEDNDGLSNQQELDGWMISVDRIGLGERVAELVTSDPRMADTDNDGLTDQQEYQKTNPRQADTDGDSLSDFDEANVYLSIPTTVDTDGDSVSNSTSNPQLWDGEEINKWGTSPSLADTDGDNRSDFDEIISNATNPLVAQVPLVAVSFVGNIDISLDVTYQEAEAQDQSFGSSYASTETSANSRTNGQAITNSVENTTTIGVEVGSGLPPSASVSYSRSSTTGYSNESSSSLTSEASQSAQREYQRMQSFAREFTEETTSGSLSMGMMVSNPSEIAYSLTNLTVTVFLWDALTDQFKTVGTMTPQGLSELNLAPGMSLPAPVQVQAENLNVDLVRQFMRDPKSLVFAVSNFDMENSEGLNYVFLDEVTQTRTGRVIIDYGNGEVDDYRVATNVMRNTDGSLAGVKLATVFNNYLKIPFETAAWVPHDDAGPLAEKAGTQVLTRVRDVQNTPEGEPSGFWVVFSDIADLQNTYKDFGETVLQRGETIFIAYMRDRDGDGVYDREEDFHQTSDEMMDSDGDNLTDFEEVKQGWIAGTGLPSTTGYPRQVYSSPISRDVDEDGLEDDAERMMGTDPFNPDTDNDLILDGVDSDPLDNSNEPPEITLSTTLTDDPLVTLTGTVTDSSDLVTEVHIDWGDGQSDTLMQGFDSIELSHAYFVPNTYTITVSATDERQGMSVQTYMVTTTTPYAIAHYPMDGNSFQDVIAGKNANVSLAPSDNSAYDSDRFGTGSAFAMYKSVDNDQFTYAYVQSFGTIPLDTFSISFWRKNGGNGDLLTQPNRFRIYPEPNSNMCIALGDDTQLPPVCTTGNHSDDWTMYTIVKDGLFVRMYVNDTLNTSTTREVSSSQSCSALFINGNNTSSGCNTQQNTNSSNDASFIHNMLIDDIRIFGRALSPSDISALYTEGGYTP